MANSSDSRSFNYWLLWILIKSESVSVCVCVCLYTRFDVAAPEVKPLLIRNVFTRDFLYP